MCSLGQTGQLSSWCRDKDPCVHMYILGRYNHTVQIGKEMNMLYLLLWYMMYCTCWIHTWSYTRIPSEIRELVVCWHQQGVHDSPKKDDGNRYMTIQRDDKSFQGAASNNATFSFSKSLPFPSPEDHPSGQSAHIYTVDLLDWLGYSNISRPGFSIRPLPISDWGFPHLPKFPLSSICSFRGGGSAGLVDWSGLYSTRESGKLS